MAEGIDRKNDDKLEFVSSKEVSVAPTFEAMVSAHLFFKSSVTLLTIASAPEREPSARHLCLRL